MTIVEMLKRWFERTKSFYSIRGRLWERVAHLDEITGHGLIYGIELNMAYLPKKVIAQTSLYGMIITFNARYLGEEDQKFLEETVLDHELVHCQLFHFGVFVAIKDCYYQRFHEAYAYYLSGCKLFWGFLDALEEEMPGAPLAIYKEILKFKGIELPTLKKKDKACRKITGLGWHALRAKYMRKAEEVIRKPYPCKTLPAASLRYEDYKRWKEAQEKKAKPKEGKKK